LRETGECSQKEHCMQIENGSGRKVGAVESSWTEMKYILAGGGGICTTNRVTKDRVRRLQSISPSSYSWPFMEFINVISVVTKRWCRIPDRSVDRIRICLSIVQMASCVELTVLRTRISCPDEEGSCILELIGYA
jgi:hypothetical protein